MRRHGEFGTDVRTKHHLRKESVIEVIQIFLLENNKPSKSEFKKYLDNKLQWGGYDWLHDLDRSIDDLIDDENQDENIRLANEYFNKWYKI